MKLTQAQKDALVVLGGADGRVSGWKRKTRSYPVMTINFRAADSLVRMGLAKAHIPESIFWSAYTHDEKYSITDKGREVLDAL